MISAASQRVALLPAASEIKNNNLESDIVHCKETLTTICTNT